jgi:hypothetical protein
MRRRDVGLARGRSHFDQGGASAPRWVAGRSSAGAGRSAAADTAGRNDIRQPPTSLEGIEAPHDLLGRDPHQIIELGAGPHETLYGEPW